VYTKSFTDLKLRIFGCRDDDDDEIWS
jgi:hypothetical protein